MPKILIFLMLFVAGTGGCAAREAVVPTKTGQVATTSEVARAHYLRGLASLREGDFEAAFKSFSAAARAPSHIEYSKLARLRLADTLYYQDMFDEAAVAYTAFINSSANNPNLHYALFRLADCKVKSISGDFFLVPPSDRRDQKMVRSALDTIQRFVRAFPDSPYCAQVLQMRDKIVDTVSSYELEVARFYMTRKKPQGAVGRMRRLMKDIPSSRDSEKVRVAYIEALAAVDESELLAAECADYRERFPGGKRAAKVASLCGREVPISLDEDAISDGAAVTGGDVDTGASGETMEVGDVR